VLVAVALLIVISGLLGAMTCGTGFFTHVTAKR
jgi:hypothetical protein